MKYLFLVVPAFLLCACNSGKPTVPEPEVYKIYEGVAPGAEGLDYPEVALPEEDGSIRIYNVTEPTITVYRPNPENNTGAAMIIAPGGGNMYLTWDEEGINVARWFQEHGVTGIILKYRTHFLGNSEEEIRQGIAAFWASLIDLDQVMKDLEEGKEPNVTISDSSAYTDLTRTIQGDDGRQAVKYVREHAAQLGVNPHKIGIMGFSAGGALTSDVMYFNDNDTCPDLAAPIYGFRGGQDLPEHPVPTFLCAPEWDLFPADLAFGMYRNYQAAHLPAELHFIHEATHGDGLKDDGKEWNEWIDLLYGFMKAVKFVE